MHQLLANCYFSPTVPAQGGTMIYLLYLECCIIVFWVFTLFHGGELSLSDSFKGLLHPAVMLLVLTHQVPNIRRACGPFPKRIKK